MNIGRLDWFSIILALAASLFGIITIYGSGGSNVDALVFKKTVWLILGIILMFVFAYINYQNLGSYSFILYGIGMFLLLIVLVPFIGTKVKGARSWIRIFGLGFQPSEIMKLFIVIALSKYLVLRESEIGKLKELIIPFFITMLPVFLIILQPDLGSAVLLLPILLVLLFLGGANVNVIIGIIVIGLVTAFIPMYLEYQKYIIIDDIKEVLKTSHYKITDAIRILKFEIWHFVDYPEKAKETIHGSYYYKWAIKTITSPENLKIFKETAEKIFTEKGNFLRDFLSSNTALLWTIIINAFIYFIGWLGFFMTRTKWMKAISHIALIITLSLTSAFIVKNYVKFKPHQVVRIVSFANPDKFPKGAGYQLKHSLITIGSGQIMGKGMFHGDMTKGKTPFLPEWYNDFIFSVVGEQFGFIRTSLLLFILFGLVIRGAIIALRSKDKFGALLAGGISVIFFMHIFINIGITLGLFPVTGIPLSFVSYGGSNMLLSFISLGILQNINMRRFIN